MKKKRNRQRLSILMAAFMTMTGFAIPAKPAPEEVFASAEAITDAREINFNRNWKFKLGDEEGAEAIAYEDSDWEDEQLPHDFSITQEYSGELEAESGFLPGGAGWYRKTFTLPGDYQGKAIVLNFDGVYNHAYVYVNGQKLGENHYGYNDFAFDISDYVTCDGKTENVVAVKVVHNTPSSRWYSGTGIYRDVKLVVTDQVHVARNGTYVTTPNLESQKNGNVTVKVDTKVQNDSSASVDAVVRTSIVDDTGTEVAAPSDEAVTVDAEAAEKVSQNLLVNKPKLWNCETPNLYYVKTEILVGGTVKDTYKTTFGFRYIKFDPNTGFSLNGENVKLKGVCMHHDQGALGSAAYRDAIYRQVEKLKEMGCNAIRTSHSTPADILLDACNELGVMVMDETYDGWEYAKNENNQDFSTHFSETLAEDNQILGGTTGDTWYKFVLESNIERDKNDPSVIMWDIGNELSFGVPAQNNYVQYAENMINYIKAIDNTRPITSGDNNPGGNVSSYPTDFRNKITKKLAESGGIAGMNYSMGEIANVHNAHPDWTIVATETVSPSNSRGIYSTTGHYGKAGDYQCTAYDTDWVSWGNSARESWWYTIKDDFVSGEFIWTGFDYIGEPTPWNGTGTGIVSGDRLPVPNSSYFGVIDTAGFPKDSFYFYTSQWREDATTLHVVPQSWNEEDLAVGGGKVPVYIYSNAAKVELYLNNKLVGTATRNVNTTNAGHVYATYSNVSDNAELCTAVNEYAEWKRMAAQFSVTYEEGTLTAKAYDENGQVIEETLGLDSVKTNSDEGTYLKITTEKEEIQADGSSLCYISVDIEDKDGNFVSAARDNIRFTLNGNGTIVGVDNGNPSTVDKFQQKTVLTSEKAANIDAFSGKALVIVRSTEFAGGFTVKAEAAGLKGASTFVNTVGDTVGEPFLKEYHLDQEYTVVMGTAPTLQKTVVGIMTDGSKLEGKITWEPVTEKMYNTPGEYVLKGVLKAGSEEIAVTANLHVKPIIAAMKNYSMATTSGFVPNLPQTVSAILPDGSSYGKYPVTWETIKADDVKKVGTILTVNGTAFIEEGVTAPVKATVRVAEGVTVEAKNVAPEYSALTESCGQKADNLFSITNGVNNVLDNSQERWTNWNDHLTNSSPFITFTWSEVKELGSLKAWFFGDENVTAPEEVKIEVSEDGVNYIEASFEPVDYTVNQENIFKLDVAQKAKSLKFTMTQKGTGYVGLTELEIWTTDSGYENYSTALLNSLTVNGKTVPGFISGTYNGKGYDMEIDDVKKAVIRAESRENASVTVVPADKSNVVRVMVEAEDQSVKNTYEIRLKTSMPGQVLLNTVQTEIQTAEGKIESQYTADSWKIFQQALSAAKAAQANKNTTKFEMELALSNLRKAAAGLKTVPSNGGTEKLPYAEQNKTGSVHGCNGAKYKITKTGTSAKDCTVTYMGPEKKNRTSLNIPATVKINGTIYKVTAIANKACRNNKKLKKVTVGKNVRTIGTSAFAGNAKLKSIVVKSSSLKKVGKKALKGVNAKCKIKVPKKKWKAYARLFKGKGQKAGVKVVK